VIKEKVARHLVSFHHSKRNTASLPNDSVPNSEDLIENLQPGTILHLLNHF